MTWDERRYSAQTGLIGQEGQDKLLAARVLIIGAGGLGAPVIQYLAAAGVNVTIADGDRVEASNLNRQVLFTAMDAKRGAYKLILGFDPLEERFFIIDCQNLKIDAIRLKADPECQGGVHVYARHLDVPE